MLSLDTGLAIAGLAFSVVIFVYQLRLSNQQGRLSRDLGELELREKLGPIQFRAMELKTYTRLFKNYSVELSGALLMLKEIPHVEERLSTAVAVQKAVDKIQSDDDDEFLKHIRGLQHESVLRSEFEILDACIEEIQREMTNTTLQIQGDKCQIQIRSLIETAERLGQESVYLLTDTRAVEAVYSHATDNTKKELATLLSTYWIDPLCRLPAPAGYRGGKFGELSLAETLKREAKQIAKSVENGEASDLS